MWPRVVEAMLACWLAISPFVFRHEPEQTHLWAVDFGSALAVMAFSLAAYHPRWAWANLGTLAVAVALCAWGYVAGGATSPAIPAEQNHMLSGLLLAMFAVIPTRCNEPPSRWREHFSWSDEVPC
jgi:hypothetical protein